MSLIREIETNIEKKINGLGYDVSLELALSNRPDLGQFQINDAMKLAKIHKKNPLLIANEILEVLNKEDFVNLNVAGNGFINITLSDKLLINFANKIRKNVTENIDKKAGKTIFLDYGGANVAKALHVGHLRSPNIGGAINRLLKTMDIKTITDVHLGDLGLQSGLVLLEVIDAYPDLPCFKEDYNGEKFDLPFGREALKVFYPTGSKKSKEDEDYKERAKKIVVEIQKGHIGYSILWSKIVELSLIDIRELYDKIGVDFDLWEGEIASFKYVPELFQILKDKKLTYVSEGALVADVKEESDNKEVPPILLEKSDGAYLYATTDLATILSRKKRFDFNEMWYFADLRQDLHFLQVFRAAEKSGIVDKNVLSFYGFGTINGKDNKPFKTRDGDVMSLEELLTVLKEEVTKKINRSIVDEKDIEETAETIALSALKYADLLPFRGTDYVFDIEKFCDFDGKTGPYLLYSTVRIKSLLNKATEANVNYDSILKLKTDNEREILSTIFYLPKVVDKSYTTKSLNELAEYIYKLNSIYNKFYSENKILMEEEKEQRESWLALSKLVYDINLLILKIFGIKVPEKM